MVSSEDGTGQIGLGLTQLTSLYLNDLFQGPFSRHSPFRGPAGEDFNR